LTASTACSALRFGRYPYEHGKEARLEDRLDHELARLLDHPVADRGDPQRTRATIRLRDLHPQHRLRAIPFRPQVVRKRVQEAVDAVMLHIFDAHTIDPGPPPVRSHLHPGPPQNVGPDDAVVQSVEPSAPILLGRKVQSALKGS
jgi:hypothetical protein